MIQDFNVSPIRTSESFYTISEGLNMQWVTANSLYTNTIVNFNESVTVILLQDI